MKCPHIKTIRAGDELQYFCTLVDKVCLLVGGYECEEWIEIQKERQEEK